MLNRYGMLLAVTALVLLAGCAKKNLIIDLGNGDKIVLEGAADNFFCDDPAYAEVEKVRTWTLQFVDGNKYLCAPKGSPSVKARESSTANSSTFCIGCRNGKNGIEPQGSALGVAPAKPKP